MAQNQNMERAIKKGPIFRKHNQYSNLEGTLQYGNMGCLVFKGGIQN